MVVEGISDVAPGDERRTLLGKTGGGICGFCSWEYN